MAVLMAYVIWCPALAPILLSVHLSLLVFQFLSAIPSIISFTITPFPSVTTIRLHIQHIGCATMY